MRKKEIGFLLALVFQLSLGCGFGNGFRTEIRSVSYSLGTSATAAQVDAQEVIESGASAESTEESSTATGTAAATSEPGAKSEVKTGAPAVSIPSDCSVVGKALEVTDRLEKSITELGGAPGTLVLNQVLTQRTSVTVGGHVKLCFGASGRLDPVENVVVRIAQFNAGKRSLFLGSGQILFSETSPTTIYPEWFGAVGDGSTDNASAFRRALNSLSEVRGRTIVLENKSYAMTLNPGLIVPEGNGIDGQGASILARITGDTEYPYLSDKRHMFSMRSDTFLKNLTLNSIPMPRSAVSVLRHFVQVGLYETGRGFKNVSLENLKLVGGLPGEIGINVWGDSSNVRMKGITFPSNENLGTAIAVQWSWDPADPTNRPTQHPFDVLIEDVHIENMPFVGLKADGTNADPAKLDCWEVCGNWGIWLSAPYNVTIRNVNMGTVGTGFYAYAGDYGNYLAPASVKSLVGTGIVVENLSIARATVRGIVANGQPVGKYSNIPNFSQYITNLDMPVTFKNVKASGIGAAARVQNTSHLAGQGFMTFHTKGVWVYNSEFTSFAYGMEVYEGVSNLYIEWTKVRQSSYGGISLVGDVNARAYNISIKSSEISDANMMQTTAHDAAAISIGKYVDGVVIDSCHITAYTPYYQYVGVYILGGNQHYLSNNWVSAVAPGGAGYGTPSGVRSAWYIRNNGANPGIPVYFGNPIYF